MKSTEKKTKEDEDRLTEGRGDGIDGREEEKSEGEKV